MAFDEKKERENKATYDQPISLHPLSFKETLEALLKTPPMPKEEKTKKKRTEKGLAHELDPFL